ncbi:MAG: acyl-CoA dehydrogenase family protein, partial [Candidatus Palauibacterales bacterium]|nr:acyl-CoA dehydrogenase family protein [Candidatus Palauibacterales bacterium]
MIEELYTSDQMELRDRARDLAETVIRPAAARYDAEQTYPWEFQTAIKDAGLSGVWLPQEYGGLGGGVLDLCIVVEEFSRACGGMGVCYAVNATGSLPLLLGGTDEQKERWLPGIAAGEDLIAFG